jgi:hypothetical protein
MAALTYQNQHTATTAANSSQQMNQYMQTLAQQQDLLHQNQHRMMEQMAALSFNQSNTGRGIRQQGRGPPQSPATFAPNGFPPPAPFTPNGFGRTNYGGRGGQG